MTFEAAPSSFPSSFPSGLPTDLNEQQQIVDYLDRKCGAIDRVLAVKKQQLEKLEIHERSMIYDYVTGVKRVRSDLMKAIETKIFHGEIHQHFRERNLTDHDEKEKLSVLIKELNGNDDISEIVDMLSHKPTLKSVANNAINTKKEFATEFREFFLRILSDMLDDGKIELDSYTRFYDGWEQVSDLVYTKIKNTKA